MSAQEITMERVAGKTYCDSKSCTTFNKNGTISGVSGPWSSSGTYKVKDDGTVCLYWSDPNWAKNNSCHQYNNATPR